MDARALMLRRKARDAIDRALAHLDAGEAADASAYRVMASRFNRAARRLEDHARENDTRYDDAEE